MNFAKEPYGQWAEQLSFSNDRQMFAVSQAL